MGVKCVTLTWNDYIFKKKTGKLKWPTSKKSLAIASNNLKNSEEGDNAQGQYNTYADTYALILYKQKIQTEHLYKMIFDNILLI